MKRVTMLDNNDGAMVKYEPPTQEIMLEMRIKVKTPKMAATRLAEGVARIITKGWPKCIVTLENIQMISVADAELAFKSQDDDDDEDEG